MDDPVGDAVDELVVGDDHARRALLAHQLPDEREERRAGLAIELPGRLVRQEEPGPDRECGSDRDPLLLAAGQFGGEGASPTAQAERVEELLGATARGSRGDAPDGEGQLDCLADRVVGRDRETVVLLDHADRAAPVAPELAVGGAIERPAEDPERAGRWPGLTGEESEERRLATAGRTDDRHELARIDGEIQAAQRLDRAGCARVDRDERARLDSRIVRLSHAEASVASAEAPTGAEAPRRDRGARRAPRRSRTRRRRPRWERPPAQRPARAG